MYLAFTRDDFDVAEILLTLDTSHRETTAACGFTLSWAKRRTRSPRRRRRKSLTTALVSRSQSSIFPNADVAPSPAVDTRQKPHSNKLAGNGHYLKRKRDRLLDTMDELTRENKFLSVEKENFHLTLLKLKTENLQLKAHRQHILSSDGKFLRNLPAGENVDGPDQPSRATVNRQPLIVHPTVHIQGRTEGLYVYPYSQLVPVRSQPWSKTYRDGDVDVDQPLDLGIAKSTAAALARRRRKEIYKSKSSPKNSLYPMLLLRS